MDTNGLNLYVYKATIISLYDGDSGIAKIDLGFNITIEMKLRFAFINTPELKGDDREKGLISRDYVRELLLNKEVIIETLKDRKEKYGRMLAVIYLDGLNVNEHLVKEGYAKYYE